MRRVAGTILLTLAIVATAGMYAPMPWFGPWMARLVFRETALLVALFALAAGALGTTRRRWAVALGCAALASLPFVRPRAVLSREGVKLSLREYALGPARIDVTPERDVQLVPERGDLLADVYRAPQPGPRPFVLVIHGGSWRFGDKGEVPQVSRRLAAAGMTVLDVRYRLAPKDPFPAAPADLRCLLSRLPEQAGRLGIDPARGALVGRSAGGHLALLTGYVSAAPADEAARIPVACPVPGDAGAAPAQVKAVVGIYPLVDMVDGHDNPSRPDPIDGPESVELFMGGSPGQRPEAYALATPTTWVKPGRALPPTLLIHGAGDALVRVSHSLTMERVLREAGQPVKLIVIPMADHGFDFRPGGVGEQLERAVLLSFLRTHLHP